MEEIRLDLEISGGFAFSIDMDEVAQAELSYNEVMKINEAIKMLEIREKGRHSAFWNRKSETLTLL